MSATTPCMCLGGKGGKFATAPCDPISLSHRMCMGTYSAPIDLHYSMFTPTLENQCTVAQREKWLPLARGIKIIGTYAQTEMGHG